MPKRANYPIPDIQQLFDKVNPRYRLGNLLISGGTISYTRSQATRVLPRLADHDWMLDVACGQSEFARVVYAIQGPKASFRTVGLDFSPRMLNAGRGKNHQILNQKNLLHFIQGDALALPFPDKTFKAIIISWGLRNLYPRKHALAEFFRVAKEQGVFVCLETSHANSFPARFLQNIHFNQVVPLIGTLLRRKEEYCYLSRSVASFPAAVELKREIEAEGWADVQTWPLLGGTVMIHAAIRPKG
ncbi:MAG: ubiquinone/menaquinone biosynthesis methyltransferase [Candidatus Hodarchaeales archaeon]|jgi:demethylmenaquinone methyltransferase/2-methoxy-6-polyprenyl-1,4-benzoquinol methylase